MDLVVERVEPSPGVGLGRPVERPLQLSDLVLPVGGTSHDGTHRSFPVRDAWTKQRPFPRRGFCCPVGSSGTTAASDALPAPAHFPVLPVIGRDAPTTSTQAAGPGRASPVPAATLRAFRAPYAGKSLGAAIQALHPFRGLRPDNPGSALPRPRQGGMGQGTVGLA